jgi:TRAP-type C4-dicarboxylate transport system substrate-binding protein
LRVVVLYLALFLAAGPIAKARADEATLSIATTTPGDYVVAAKVLAPWAERVNAAGAGLLHVNLRNGTTIATAANVFDRVSADVVQMDVGIPGLIGGRFPLTDVVALPFVVSDAEKASIAFWRLYKMGLLDREYTDFVPLAMSMYPAPEIHLAKPPASLEDLRGLRLRVGSKITGEVVTRLGGTPVAFDPADIYGSLQHGLIDGVTMAWTGVRQLSLSEITTYHIEGEFGTNADIIFIARRAYEGLSPAARKVIDDNSGEQLSRALGRLYDDESRAARAPIASSDKHKIVDLSPAEAQRWADEVKPVIDRWVSAHPGGEQVLAAYRTLLAAAEAAP